MAPCSAPDVEPPFGKVMCSKSSWATLGFPNQAASYKGVHILVELHLRVGEAFSFKMCLTAA